jgi:subtilisin family serine protease
MPIVKYGGKQGSVVELVESEQLIAVRTRSQKPIGSRSNVREPIESELEGCDLMYHFPEAGVEIYRVPSGEKTAKMDARKRSLSAFPDVRFAGGVLVDPQDVSPVLYTENLYVRFDDQLEAEECERIVREASLSIKEKLGFALNAYFVQAAEGTGQRVFEMALELLDRAEVQVCHPELVRPKNRKAFFPPQWHLASTSINGMVINQHAHVDAAHAVTRGKGSTIAIVDDGVDIDHVEFSTPGKIVAPLDAMSGTNDPRPRDSYPQYPDNHGTACAGVACASGIDGAVGVAPDARLMPIRLAANLGSMAEAKAFKWAADHGADVISCSWGPRDGRWYSPNDPTHNMLVPLPDSTRDAMNYAISQGRSGLGCVILFAAGNGNESVENDGYASHNQTIAVAACNDRGTRSVYSDFGPSVWCSFPSNDFGYAPFSHPDPLTPGIWTVDRSGTAGYNAGSANAGDAAGNYTNAFGGTSSACPGAAGVCALILSVNPNLAWIEVRDILRRACDQIDAGGGNYGPQGHSEWYGYGRINALRAVELAKPRQVDRIQIARTFSKPIPDRGAASVSLQVAENALVAELTVEVDIQHTFVGDLVLFLTSPGSSGQTITLQAREGGSRDDLKRTYRSTMHSQLAKLHGKASGGEWTLRVQDRAARDTGVIRSFGLKITLANSQDTRAAAAKSAHKRVKKTTRKTPKRAKTSRGTR